MDRSSSVRVADEPAFILHARPYRETSLLLECLTRGHGRVGLVARGVRKERSRLPRGILQPLQPLTLEWLGSGELYTLVGAETSDAPLRMDGDRLYSAMYLNELILRLCARSDPHSGLFEHYATCLQRLAAGEPQGWTLRRFERDLMIDLGYGLVLDRDCDTGLPISSGIDYAYLIDSGPQVWQGDSASLRVSGAALLALAQDTMPRPECIAELRRLMRVLLQHQLGGGSLNAWELSRRIPPRQSK